MFEHFKRYPWVLETYEYPSSERLIAGLSKHVIDPAEKYAQSVGEATTQRGEAIGAANATVVLVGPHGFGNTQQYECELAFVRQSRERTFPVMPVILPGASTDLPFNFLQVLTQTRPSNFNTR